MPFYSPSSDITAGGWVAIPAAGSALFDAVNEARASDADYIQSGQSPSVDTVEVKYAGAIDPGTLTGHVVRYRIRGDANTKLTVALVCGTTIIKSWVHDPAPLAFTEFDQTLTQGEAASIADYSDLRLRLTGDVISTGGGGTTPPSAANSKYRNGQPYLFQSIVSNTLGPRLDPAVYIPTEESAPGVPIPASYAYVVEALPTHIVGIGQGSPHIVTPTQYFADQVAGWAWDQAGGDILDLNLVHNPVTPTPWHSWAVNFSSSAAVANTYSGLNCLAMVQYCQTNSRWLACIFKMSTSTRYIASKISPTPPFISITYADGATATLACRVFAQLTTATAMPQGAQAVEYQVASTSNHIVMEFERPEAPSVHGAVTAATITFRITRHSTGANLQVYLADPILNTDLVQTGVAQAAGVGFYDSGITSQPSIYGAHLHPDGTTLAQVEYMPGTVVNVGDETASPGYDPGLFIRPFNAANANPVLYANKLPHLALGKWIGGTWPHVQFEDSVRTIVPSTYTGDGFVPLAPGIGAMRVNMEVNPQWQADGVVTGSSAPHSSTTDIRIFLPADKWGTDSIFIRYYFRIGSPLGQPYRMNFADVRQGAGQPASFPDKAFTRSGTVATITSALHPFSTGDKIAVNNAGGLSLSANRAVTKVDDNTITLVCNNSGATSGTINFSADPDLYTVPGPGVLVGGLRGPGKVGRYDWSDCAGKMGIMPDHWSASGGTSGVAGGGRGWQLRNRWCDWFGDTSGPNVGGYGFGLHTYDFVCNPLGSYNAAGDDDDKTNQSGYGQRGGLGGFIYADTWYCFEHQIILNTVYPATSFKATWTRSGAVCTITKTNHGLVRPTIAVTASDANSVAIPCTVGNPVTIIDAHTFSIPCNNAGPTSGDIVVSDFLQDGTIRFWLDGRLAYERTDFVFRTLPYYYPLAGESASSSWPTHRHPNNYDDPGVKASTLRPTANLGLRSLWLNWFHGGITPNTIDRVQFYSQIAYGSSYIGPMKEPPPDVAPTPAWLAGKTIGEWVQLSSPSTRFDQMTDMQTIVNARLAAPATFAMISDEYPTETVHVALGEPRRGPFGDCGGCLRTNGSEMIISGGGGAGTWAGNDVRGLRLEDDAPQWRVLVRPTGGSNYNGEFIPVKNNAGQLPPVGQGRVGEGNMPYNKDKDGTVATALLDGSPIARHTYRHQIVDDATDDFHYTRCDSVWPTDLGRYEDVNSIHLPQQFGPTYNSVTMASTWPNARPADRIHPKPGGTSSPLNYCWTCKYPTIAGDARSGYVYQAMGSGIFVYQPNFISGGVRGKWTPVTSFGADKGSAAVDPVRGILLFGTTTGMRAPQGTSPTVPVLPIYKVLVLNATGDGGTVMPVAFTMGSGFTAPTLVEEIGFNEWTTGEALQPGRSEQQRINQQAVDIAELEYDQGLDKFLWFQDDQRLMTLTFTGIISGTYQFRFDVLNTSGTPPPLYGSCPLAGRALIAMWGRMRYVHRLRGVAFVQNYNTNAYFLRTS